MMSQNFKIKDREGSEVVLGGDMEAHLVSIRKIKRFTGRLSTGRCVTGRRLLVPLHHPPLDTNTEGLKQPRRGFLPSSGTNCPRYRAVLAVRPLSRYQPSQAGDPSEPSSGSQRNGGSVPLGPVRTKQAGPGVEVSPSESEI